MSRRAADVDASRRAVSRRAGAPPTLNSLAGTTWRSPLRTQHPGRRTPHLDPHDRHASAWRRQRHFWSLRPNGGLDRGGAVLGRGLANLGASVPVRAPSVPVRAPSVPVFGRAARSARISMWTGAWSAVGAPASILAPRSPTKPRICRWQRHGPGLRGRVFADRAVAAKALAAGSRRGRTKHRTMRRNPRRPAAWAPSDPVQIIGRACR